MTTPANGVWVESWYEDLDDITLPILQKFLEELVINEVDDVREYLSVENTKLIQGCLVRGETIPCLE